MTDRIRKIQSEIRKKFMRNIEGQISHAYLSSITIFKMKDDLQDFEKNFLQEVKKMNTKINNMIILKKDLSDGAFKLYCTLAMLARNDEKDGCVSIHTLAEISGKTPENVQTLIKELIEKELIGWSAKKLLDNLKWFNTPSLFNLRNNLAHLVMDYDTRFGYFSFVDEVAGIVLFPEAYRLYRIFAMLTGEDSRVYTNLKELSKLFGKNKKDTRKWLDVLINTGIIEIIAPDTYIIHDALRDNREE